MKIKLLIISCFLGINLLKSQDVYYPSNSLGDYFSYKFNNKIQFQQKRRVAFIDTSNIKTFDILLLRSNSYLDHDNLSVFSNKKILKCMKNGFYNYTSSFYALKGSDYFFSINPVLQFSSGKETSTNKTLYQNTRGAEIWGNIGGSLKGIGFYSLFTENQIMMPNDYQFYKDSLNFVPHELFYKPFKKNGAVDFFQARAYITFNAAKNYVKFQFGHDKHKIGNGYRSLILSDFAPQYLFLKINTDIKKFHYQNLFTQFNDNGPILGNTLFGKKYGAFHRLSFDILNNLQIGFSEMVIFDRKDSTQSNQFDFNYLNPVIFYRAVESNLGSRDNSLMAFDFEMRIRQKGVVYGQFLLDEFNLKYLKTQPNWWANKYGYQIGGRYFDAFKIKNFDLLLEYNRMRPYTYSHYRTTQSYSHFNQSLAHPLGANFGEGILEIRYILAKKLFLTNRLIVSKSGKDSSLMGNNYGGNILRNYNSRVTDFSSKMFMGKTTSLIINELIVSYMLKHNLFFDLRINYRKENKNDNLFVSLGLRLNSELKKYDF